MAATTYSNIIDTVKDQFDDSGWFRSINNFNRSPLLAMIKKNVNVGARYIRVPFDYSTPQNIAISTSHLSTVQKASSFEQFLLQPKPLYCRSAVSYEMKQNHGGANAPEDLVKMTSDEIINSLFINLGHFCWSNGYGLMGKINGIDSTTLTLDDKFMIRNFWKGQYLDYSSNSASGGENAKGNTNSYVTAVDYDAGTVTVSSLGSTSAAEDGDYIFLMGGFTTAGTPGMFTGIRGWAPVSAAPSSLFGVDLTDGLLCGTRTTTVQSSLIDTIRYAFQRHSMRPASRPNVIFMNQRDVDELCGELAGQVVYKSEEMKFRRPQVMEFSNKGGVVVKEITRESEDVVVAGLSAPYININGSLIPVIADNGCEINYFRALDLNALSLEFYADSSSKAPVEPLKKGPDPWVQDTVNGQFVCDAMSTVEMCNRNPGATIIGKLRATAPTY